MKIFSIVHSFKDHLTDCKLWMNFLSFKNAIHLNSQKERWFWNQWFEWSDLGIFTYYRRKLVTKCKKVFSGAFLHKNETLSIFKRSVGMSFVMLLIVHNMLCFDQHKTLEIETCWQVLHQIALIWANRVHYCKSFTTQIKDVHISLLKRYSISM